MRSDVNKDYLIYTIISALSLCLPQFVSKADYNYLFLIINSFIFLIYFIAREKNYSLGIFELLCGTYVLWILIAFILHRTALLALDPLYFITMGRKSVYWGLEILDSTTCIYLLYPLLILLAVSLFQSFEKSYQFIVSLPLFFIPSITLFLYNSNFENGENLKGLSTDGSAFGMSLYLLIPLSLCGVITSSERLNKIMFCLLTLAMVLCLYLRLQRTAIAGLILVCIMLPWVINKFQAVRFKEKYLKSNLTLVLLLLSLSIGLFITLKNNDLRFAHFTTIFQSVRTDDIEGFISELSRGRFLLAKQVLQLFILSPIAGWGPGGILCNIENIQFANKEILFVHNAANHYLQLCGELGILGCLLNISLHLLPIWMVFTIRDRIADKKERFVVAFCFLVMVVWMVLYIAGPHTMAIDVLWIAAVYTGFSISTALKYGYHFPSFKRAAIVLFVVVSTLLFTLGTYTATYGNGGYKGKQNQVMKLLPLWFGFYPPDNWNEEMISWTMKKSSRYLRYFIKDYIGITIHSQPENSSDPLGLHCRLFIEKKLVDEINLFNGASRNLFYYLPPLRTNAKGVLIETEVARTFSPRRYFVNSDNRQLGVALSLRRDTATLPAEGIGFYQTETAIESPISEWPKDKPFRFRWTGGQASMPVTKLMVTDGFNAFMWAHHPDIVSNKVILRIFGNEKHLMTKDFNSNNWQKIIIPSGMLKGVSVLTFQVNRTWNPKLAAKSLDERDLGVALALPTQ